MPLRAIAHSGPLFEIREVDGMIDLLVSNAELGRAFAEKLSRQGRYPDARARRGGDREVGALCGRPQSDPKAASGAVGVAQNLA